MSPTINRYGASQSAAAHQPDCCCPACVNLECMERPRFFAGQLLTEADLNSEQAYVLAKNRLHNRYLHGVGVVCGLEVTCGECDGWVSIAPGYAIDPCGNDIIVCSPQDFNLIQAIQDCCAKQKAKPGCRPYDPAPPKGCTDLEEEWCVTIRYQEKEARPTASLPRTKASCGCGCGCGTKKKTCGCGCHSSGNGNGSNGKAKSNGSSTATDNCQNPPMSVCEPTRIVETFQLGACFHEKEKETLGQALSDTLLFRILRCLKGVWAFVGGRLVASHRAALFDTAFVREPSVEKATLFEAHSRFYRAVIDLYTQNPYNVRCSGFYTLQQIQTPIPVAGEDNPSYLKRVSPWTVSLFGLIVQYAIDCICHNLLPPCPGDACDDRLILACATIKNGKILRICNFSCRKFAGSFPSFFYWLSAVPVAAILKWLVERLCCRPDLVRAQSPITDDFAGLLGLIDPSGKIRSAVVENDFSFIHRYGAASSNGLGQIAAGFMSFLFNPGDVSLASFAGKPAEEAARSLEQFKIETSTVEVRSADEVPTFETLFTSPFASEGDRVVLYTNQGKVVSANRIVRTFEGFRAAATPPSASPAEAAAPESAEPVPDEAAPAAPEAQKPPQKSSHNKKKR